MVLNPLGRRRRRTAFTLVELLVVIAVIGILIALLLPAVQAARENARRMQCANNLKQIGTAIQAYSGTIGTLPPGNFASTWGTCPGLNPITNPADSEDRGNWMILLLPYLEQHSLHRGYNFHIANEEEKNRTLRETAVTAYLCPSDLDANRLQVPSRGPAREDSLNVGYRPGSYRGVAGRSDGYAFLDGGNFNDFPRADRGPMHVVGIKTFTPERVRDIRDGTSQTLLAGESTTRSNPGYRTLWAYSFEFYSLSSGTPQARIFLGDYDRCCQEGGQGYDSPCRRGWGSNHRGGINFLVCDGSVHFLSTEIDPELFAQLTTIAGSERASIPSF